MLRRLPELTQRELVKGGHGHCGWRKKDTVDGGKVKMKPWGFMSEKYRNGADGEPPNSASSRTLTTCLDVSHVMPEKEMRYHVTFSLHILHLPVSVPISNRNVNSQSIYHGFHIVTFNA